MDKEMRSLLSSADSVVGEFFLRDGCSAGSVAAAVLSVSGQVFTGICMHLCCGIGICAEQSAIAEMLKARETQIRAIVAVSARGILPPCGRCRELVLQIDDRNAHTLVILGDDEAIELRELIPRHWLGTRS